MRHAFALFSSLLLVSLVSGCATYVIPHTPQDLRQQVNVQHYGVRDQIVDPLPYRAASATISRKLQVCLTGTVHTDYHYHGPYSGYSDSFNQDFSVHVSRHRQRTTVVIRRNVSGGQHPALVLNVKNPGQPKGGYLYMVIDLLPKTQHSTNIFVYRQKPATVPDAIRDWVTGRSQRCPDLTKL